MKKFIVPVCTDESATMYIGEDVNKFFVYDEGQTWFTRNQIMKMYLVEHTTVEEKHLQHISDEGLYALLVGDDENEEADLSDLPFSYHCFTDICVVTEQVYDKLITVSEALLKTCGGDSSTYAACHVFAVTCIAFADEVITV